jgi:uncharacterized membrane protein YdjX (TVP38/TMEM64 family)
MMPSVPSTKAISGARRVAARAIFGLLLTVAVSLALFFRHVIDLAVLEGWVHAAGIWAPIVYILAYIAATLLFLPGSLVTLAGGAVFGPLWGSVYALSGATIGATLAFLVARYVAADWVTRKSGGLLRRLLQGVEDEGWRFVAFVRLVPLFPFNFLNYALGLARISLRDYVLASFVCMAPGTIAYVYLGYAGREALAGEKSAVQNGLLALALLAAVVFIPRILLKMRGQRKS